MKKSTAHSCLSWSTLSLYFVTFSLRILKKQELTLNVAWHILEGDLIFEYNN